MKSKKEHITVVPATEADVKDIVALFFRGRFRRLDHQIVKSRITNFPAIVAKNGHKLIGFVFSVSFAPDIIEMKNIYISKKYRGLGIGNQLIEAFEEKASENYAGIILLNSRLYKRTLESKKSAKDFYLRNQYQLVASTGETSIYYKALKELKSAPF
ncbi:MAG: GNAT family N-acetyltransferase [bacterium]